MTRDDVTAPAEQWTRRFIVRKDRADEVIKLYNDLGFEVKLEALDLTESPPKDECSACFLASCQSCVVLYTRPRSGSPGTSSAPDGA